ncbi:MAG: ribosome silencing factor [Fibrobacteraceae bacterium]
MTTKKKTPKKSAAKKVVAKKVSAKKPVAKKSTVKKAVKGKAPAKKAAPKKAAVKKTAAKKAAPKKAAPKKIMKKISAKKAVKTVPATPKKEALPEGVQFSAEILFALRAQKVQLIDLRGINDVADFFLVATCESEAQMQTILNELSKEYKARGLATNGFEYKEGVEWAVFDAGLDLMVHLFEQKKREEIGLDVLYRDGHVTDLDEKDFLKEKANTKADENAFI